MSAIIQRTTLKAGDKIKLAKTSPCTYEILQVLPLEDLLVYETKTKALFKIDRDTTIFKA